MSHTIKLYQVLDQIAQRTVGPIIASYHDAAAIRVFTDALSSPNTGLHEHPQDYVLLNLGHQHEDTGLIVPNPEGPITVLTGLSWKTVTQTESLNKKEP